MVEARSYNGGANRPPPLFSYPGKKQNQKARWTDDEPRYSDRGMGRLCPLYKA